MSRGKQELYHRLCHFLFCLGKKKKCCEITETKKCRSFSKYLNMYECYWGHKKVFLFFFKDNQFIKSASQNVP